MILSPYLPNQIPPKTFQDVCFSWKLWWLKLYTCYGLTTICHTSSVWKHPAMNVAYICTFFFFFKWPHHCGLKKKKKALHCSPVLLLITLPSLCTFAFLCTIQMQSCLAVLFKFWNIRCGFFIYLGDASFCSECVILYTSFVYLWAYP